MLGSACLHATWNLLAKRAKGGNGFLYLFTLLTLAVYGPAVLVYVMVVRPTFTLTHLAFAVGSGVIHVGYFVCLQRGYRVGDLSLVYPLARGSGPALVAVLAVVVLGERPDLRAVVGTAMVVLSVFVLTGGRGLLRPDRRAAVVYGLLTGLFIGCYTVWDGYAVGVLAAAPLLFTYSGEASRVLILSPWMARNRPEISAAWRDHRWEAIGVAVLSPLAYLMVLSAMRFTPVSLVAPTREISILIGTVLGTRLLAEGEGRRRLLGAAGMVIGVALLATSRQ